MHSQGSIRYSDSLHGHLNITSNTSSSHMHLQLSGLQPRATAQYHCTGCTAPVRGVQGNTLHHCGEIYESLHKIPT